MNPKMILTDVDGVLTDGRVTMDARGWESKSICYRDLDAIGVGRRAGYEFVFMTGENTEMARVLARRFGVSRAYYGAKDKLLALNQFSEESGLPFDQLVYIGDSDRDAPALKAAGLGIAPCDASIKARAAADVMTEAKGGYGVLLEVVDKLIDGEWSCPGTKGRA